VIRLLIYFFDDCVLIGWGRGSYMRTMLIGLVWLFSFFVAFFFLVVVVVVVGFLRLFFYCFFCFWVGVRAPGLRGVGGDPPFSLLALEGASDW